MLTKPSYPIKVPVYSPSITHLEEELVLECLRTSWISSKGEFINQFEKQFCEKFSFANAASVCNGTVALHVALLALGIGPGDEVIVPTLTYIASVNAIHYVGATPVFVDCDLDTWQMDPRDVLSKVTPKTKAIMAVHLYGYPCDMQSLSEIAGNKKIYLIEDCAEALGTKYNELYVGAFGDVSTFSFFGNKTMTTGEGGMVVSKSPELMKKIKKLKGQGLAEGREYWHDVVGYNYRMTNICAAIGVAQLSRFDDLLAKKIALANKYEKAFQNLPLKFHSPKDVKAVHSFWMNSVLLESQEIRDKFRDYLKEKGVETRPVFYPAHTMDMYREYAHGQAFPKSDSIAGRGVNLPSFPTITDDQFSLVIDSIGSFFAR